MKYRNTRDETYAREAVLASYMAGDLEKLALERVTALHAAKRISTEDIEVRREDLMRFLKEKGYSSWQDYTTDIRAEHNCRNNPVTLTPKPKPIMRQRGIGACYDRLIRSETSRRRHMPMF